MPFIGAGACRKRPVHAQDVADGLVRIVGNPVAFGKTYNLSGGETVTLDELARLVMRLGGDRRTVLHLPVPLCRALAKILSFTMKDPPLTNYSIAGFVNHADLDPAAAIAEIGYHPRGVRAGLAACYESKRQSDSQSDGKVNNIKRSP